MEISDENLQYMIYHVFLPPKIPQENDSNGVRKDHALLQFTAAAAHEFLSLLRRTRHEHDAIYVMTWKRIAKLLETMSDLHREGPLAKEDVALALRNMEVEDTVALHVASQNAGIVFRKIGPNSMTFESFAASLPADTITSNSGKVIKRYPLNPRLPFPVSDDTCSGLANILSYLSRTIMDDATPKSKKAGMLHREIRDVASPRFITEGLAGVLRAIGQLLPEVKTVYIHKRIDDHVLWKSAYIPWRRSPIWLVVRVALQTTLEAINPSVAHGYKAFQAFLMSQLLEEAAKRNTEQFTGELLKFMQAKVARRLAKLGDIVDDPKYLTLKASSDIVFRISKVLETRWGEIQIREAKKVQWIPPREIDVERHLQITLPNSQNFLRNLLRRHEYLDKVPTMYNNSATEAKLRSNCSHRIQNAPTRLPTLNPSPEMDIMLDDFETWVQLYLPTWIAQPRQTSDASTLNTLIDRYREFASGHYKDRPIRLSIMHMCILELWIALDQITLEWCPLLREYSPEIPEDFLDPILLMSYKDMCRLRSIETYLQSRHRRAILHGSRSVFDDVNRLDSFSNCYFKTPLANDLVTLEAQIRADALEKKKSKLQELEDANSKYDTLIEKAKNLTCQYVDVVDHWGDRISRHKPSRCTKCKTEKEANNLKLVPFEEPLPSAEVTARPIVFELRCPLPFSVWRDATVKIIRSVQAPASYSQFERIYPLKTYPPTAGYFRVAYPQALVGLASSHKSLHTSHYGKMVNIPARSDQVIITHAGHFQLFDSTKQCFLEITASSNLRTLCALKLHGVYEPLQPYITDTMHPSNSVIASRNQCPVDLSIEEYMVFAHLRAGNRLQWRNIMRALRTQSLNLCEPSVFALVVQSIWQMGPRGTGEIYREAHLDLNDEAFGDEVVAELHHSFQSLGMNWKQVLHLSLLIAIALKVLELSPHPSVQGNAKNFLSHCRRLATQWINEISNMPLHFFDQNPAKHSYNRQAIASVAVALRFTFSHALAINSESPRHDIVDYLHAITLINGVDISSLAPGLQILDDLNHRTSLRHERSIESRCVDDPNILNDVVLRIWHGRLNIKGWHPLKPPAERWWTAKSEGKEDTSPSWFHFNLVDGTLLINGKPRESLPSNYLDHPTYKSLLGSFVSHEVCPSTMRGMSYSLLYGPNKLHLTLLEEDMIIRTESGGEVLEFIPSGSLAMDLPLSLTRENCFWYIESQRNIEIRPFANCWEPQCQRSWILKLAITAHSVVGRISHGIYSTSGQQVHLIDPHCSLHRSLSQTLRPLEPSLLGMTTTVDTTRNTISVLIPRQHLTFNLGAAGALECTAVPGYAVSERRGHIGCFFGLETFLCLRPLSNGQQGCKLLVPKGALKTWRSLHGHPTVTIEVENSKGYFLYDVDRLVGRIFGSRSIESDLYLIALHAFTSGFLPDSLTRRSGTAEALDRLTNASCYSILQVSKEARTYLDLVASITPPRAFYPPHLKVMETVYWNNGLPATSQHPSFHIYAQNIVDYWGKVSVLSPDVDKGSLDEMVVDDGMRHLNQRYAYRMQGDVATTRSMGIICDADCIAIGSLAIPRCHQSESLAFRASTLAVHRESDIDACRSLWSAVKKWPTISGVRDWEWTNIEWWLKSSSPPSVDQIWCTLYRLCQQAAWPAPFQITVAIGLLGYRGFPLNLLRTLTALMGNSIFRSPTYNCPQFITIDLSEGCTFDETRLSAIVKDCRTQFTDSEEYSIEKRPDETNRSRISRAQSAYNLAISDQVSKMVKELRHYWPDVPTEILLNPQRLLKPSRTFLETKVRPQLLKWAQGRAFLEHIHLVEQLLSTINLRTISMAHYRPCYPLLPSDPSSVKALPIPLFLGRPEPPVLSQIEQIDATEGCGAAPRFNSEKVAVGHLLDHLDQHASRPFEKTYIKDLRASLESLLSSPSTTKTFIADDINRLLAAIDVATRRVEASFLLIKNTLCADKLSTKLLETCGWLSEITPYTLLRQLAYPFRLSHPDTWNNCLLNFAVLIHDVQRLSRIAQYLYADNRMQLAKEGQYRRVWNPRDHPDWLLVEIDGDFSIRAPQAELAIEMKASNAKDNILMQLNMGEGKSSVIVPILATTSRERGAILSRVIVPRAQSKQQFHFLRRTLTALSNRTIIYLPFHRQVNMSAKLVQQIHSLLQSCADNGSVWLVEPEQLLSLKLLGLDRIIRSVSNPGGRYLVQLQIWLQSHSSDILDESDDVLDTRSQVIYTMGPQNSLHAAPLRWEIIQKVLGLLKDHLCIRPHETDMTGFLVEPVDKIAAFPNIRIQSDIAQSILEELITQSFKDHKWSSPPHLVPHAIKFVTFHTPPEETIHAISAYSGDEVHVLQTLLCLRGLITSKILLHGLKDKRWRVHYGLDLKRSSLAVPYRAKDFPSLRSEFAHPDITILLTCLSYYYGGLDDEMVWQVITELLRSDTPDLTYSNWMKICCSELPQELRSVKGVDIEDKEILKDRLYPFLRHNKAVIDFYLNTYIFPRSAKEFPYKLSSSGWDLAARRNHRTAGFSGTNDGRFLLPTTIRQVERPSQQHTNAKVIAYLLREENKIVIACADFLSSRGLLDEILKMKPSPRVLLDVGALVLDCSNHEFARSWLVRHEDDRDVSAAVFFDEKENLVVVTRDGTTQTLFDSPYAKRLHQCLIYLDDAHTRGTDLQLPDCQAIVTLGPKVTKDKLVQGCMRMRRLGHGQSLIFIAPHEVIELVKRAGNVKTNAITTFNVMIWAIRETWSQLQANVPAWVAQGLSFAKRERGWETIEKDTKRLQESEHIFQEKEARTLSELYLPSAQPSTPQSSNDDISHDIRFRVQEFGNPSTLDGSIAEEVEIELIHEEEVEREVEKPPAAEPAEHNIHHDVKRLVLTGIISGVQRSFLPIGQALARTSLKLPKGHASVFGHILVTRDFYMTIKLTTQHKGAMDQFLRPVEWLLTKTDPASSAVIAISPHEANELLPDIRKSQHVRLHIFAPCTNLFVQSLDDLQFFVVSNHPAAYSLPHHLALGLNFFAGTLYLRDYKTYKDVCAALRLWFDPLPVHLEKPENINSQCFVCSPNARQELQLTSPGFEEYPLLFLRKLLVLRRNGRSLGPSHMGKILFGQKLSEEDFVKFE